MGQNFPYKSLVIIAGLFLVFSSPTTLRAEMRQGYDNYDASAGSLSHIDLEKSENLNDFRLCYSEDHLNRYPDIAISAKKESICYDKYSTVEEYKNKLNAINQSLEKLDLLKDISEKSYASISATLAELKNPSSLQNQNLIFFIVPKGAINKDNFDKYINHKAYCKIDNIVGTKNVVQSGDPKKIYFNTFQLPNKEQNIKIYKNLSDIVDFLNKNGGQKLGIIDLIRVINKANNLSNDLLLMDMPSYIAFKNYFSGEEIEKNTAVIKIEISDTQNKDPKNPSNKTIKVNVSYPTIDDQFVANGFTTKDLPPAFLETINDNLSNRLIIKMQERVAEFTRLQKEFKKSKSTQEDGMDTIRKDAICFDKTKDNKNAQNVEADAPLEKLNFTDVIKDVASDTWQKVVDGATYTYESVFNKTVEVVSFTPSPTPETPISKFIKSSSDQNPDQVTNSNSKTSGNSTNINSGNSNARSSPSPSYSPSISQRTPSPSLSPSPSSNSRPSPSPTIKITPSPTPSPSQTTRVSPSVSPSNSPSPSPSNTIQTNPSPSPSSSTNATPSANPTPTPTPTATIGPTPTPSPSPQASPSNQSFIYKSTTATVFYSILGIVEYFLR